MGVEMLGSWKSTWLVVYAAGPGFNPPAQTNHSVDKALVHRCAFIWSELLLPGLFPGKTGSKALPRILGHQFFFTSEGSVPNG